jgi:choline dehydrogenase-like flavoprotein
MLRFSDHEFLAPERDGYGARWPIKHADLDVFYEEAERQWKVMGHNEHLEELPDGAFASSEGLTATEREFKRRIEGKWRSRTVTPSRGVPLVYELPTARKSGQWSVPSTLSRVLTSAIATGNVSIRPNCVVAHLLLDHDVPRVKGVVCVDASTGQSFEILGKIFLLAASAFESVRILLNTKTRTFPDGVGNHAGLLGKGIVDHWVVLASGLVPWTKEIARFPAGAANGLIMPRFRNTRERQSNYIRGFGIWGGMQRDYTPLTVSSDSKSHPSWFLHGLIEVLPRKSNCVSLDPIATDGNGIPTLRIDLSYSDNENRIRDDAVDSIREMCSFAGLSVSQIRTTLPGQYVHELGGACMGDNPLHSVLNPYNQCWHVPNLYVIDGSCFVTSGWQNPSLTIMAITGRACERIISHGYLPPK